ncbi:MAG: hypothetical protein H6745_21285 [Deltaproteobacteria bacterium]|nr:hypothetical protein [Deltaproteobacteria bacterium]
MISAIALAATGLGGTSPDAPGGAVVCVVCGDPPPAGLAPSDVTVAWALHGRGANEAGALALADDDARCRPEAALVVRLDPAGDAALWRPRARREPWRVALAGVAPDLLRGGELVRAVAAALREEADAGALAAVPPAAEVGGGVVVAPDPGDGGGGVPFATILGGSWWTGAGGGPSQLGVDLEARVGLGDAVAVGVRAGFMPARRQAVADGELDTEALHVEALGTIGDAVGPVRLEATVGLGAEWRSATARVTTRTDAVALDSVAPALIAEGTVALPLGERLRVALTVGGRFYLGGDTWTWVGDDVVTAPAGALVAALRVGWWWSR